MDKIPADIMQTAWEVSEHCSIMSLLAQRADIVARALLAERERCAQIADEIDQPGIPGTGEWMAMGNFAGAIRDAILVPPTVASSEEPTQTSP